MKAVIIGGGSLDLDFSLSYIRKEKPQLVIAVDRGLLFCQETGLYPDVIVGDFDSVPPEILKRYRREGRALIEEYDPRKDFTDMELGMRKAMERGGSQVILLGATGTRLDHTLANIRCLSILEEAGIAAWIVDKHNRLRLLLGRTVLRREEQFGRYVSFLPFGGDVEGVTLQGFAYPLENFYLPYVNSRSVSNEMAEETAEVDFCRGRLLMIESRDF